MPQRQRVFYVIAGGPVICSPDTFKWYTAKSADASRPESDTPEKITLD